MTTKLPTVSPDQINRAQQTAVDDTTLTEARKIVDRVRHGGDAALKACIETFEQRSPKEFIIDKGDLERAFGRLPQATQVLLRRTAKRIRRFAIAQRACITPMEVAIEGGAAGHDVAPVDRAACYAPGGRFPLP
ncbi:MAG: histidinol dehydrogenase, partial [Bradymonadia bacterium]